MNQDDKKRIGLFIGREWSWPAAFISEVNGRSKKVSADFVQIGDTKWDAKLPYHVIIDRMSHEIPYYRSYLKSAILNGCYVINDPFIMAGDDKFFGLTLASHLGMETLCSVALPNKRVETENVPESFRNLTYPLNWSKIIEYVGTPATLEDISTGGNIFRRPINSLNELIEAYDQSDILTVALTRSMDAEEIIRSIVVGKEEVLLVRYHPTTNKCDPKPVESDSTAYKRLYDWSLTLTKVYGYDINEVEFAIVEGEPIVTNSSNSTPEFDINLLSSQNFRWCVEKIADLAIKAAVNPGNFSSGVTGFPKL